MKNILLILFLFSFISVVSAESGTITYTDFIEYSYAAPNTEPSTDKWDTLNVDYVNHPYITSIIFAESDTAISFPADYAQSMFTCSSGCVGGGSFWYQKSVKRITYLFDEGTRFTSGTAVLTFSNPSVYTNLNVLKHSGSAADSSHPAYVRSFTGAITGQYYVYSETTRELKYNVSYFSNLGIQMFTWNISKESGKTSRIWLRDSNYISFYSETYSTTNTTGAQNYSNGIVLEYNIQGASNHTLTINSSGISSTPEPIIPETGYNILFDKNEYFIGDIINTSWGISNTTFDTFDRFDIILSGVFDTKTFIGVSQSGSYEKISERQGTHTAKIQRCYWTTLYLSCEDVYSESVSVLNENPSYISFNRTQYARSPFNITYHIGYSLGGYSSTNLYVMITSKTSLNTIDTIYNIGTSNDGQITAQNVRMYPEGEYTVTLFDSRKNKVLDSNPLTIVSSAFILPRMNITSSNISMDKSYYFINDYAEINYRVDDVNYTNLSIMGIVVSEQTGETTKQFIHSFSEQVDSFQTNINPKDDMTCDLGFYCWYEQGNNTLRLIGYNSTHQIVLSYFNFTVSSTTVDGWGLSISKANVSTTEKLTIKTIVPSGYQGFLKIRDPGYNQNSTAVFQTPVSAGKSTYFTTITRVGQNGIAYYEIELIDTNGNVKVRAPLTVYKISDVSTPNKIGDVNTASNIWASGWFFAGLLMICFLIAGAAYASVPGAIGGLSIGVIFSYIGGLIPLWALMVFVLIIILMVAFMIAGSMTTGGGK